MPLRSQPDGTVSLTLYVPVDTSISLVFGFVTNVLIEGDPIFGLDVKPNEPVPPFDCFLITTLPCFRSEDRRVRQEAGASLYVAVHLEPDESVLSHYMPLRSQPDGTVSLTL